MTQMDGDGNENEGLRDLRSFSSVLTGICSNLSSFSRLTKKVLSISGIDRSSTGKKTGREDDVEEEGEVADDERKRFYLLHGEYKQVERLKEINESITEKLKYFEFKLPVFYGYCIEGTAGVNTIEREKMSDGRILYLEKIEELEDTLKFFRKNEIYQKENYIKQYDSERLKSYGNLRDFVTASFKGNKFRMASSDGKDGEVKKGGTEELNKIEMHHLNFKFVNRKLKKFILFLKDRKPSLFFLDIFGCYYKVRYYYMFNEFKKIVNLYRTRFISQTTQLLSENKQGLPQGSNFLKSFLINSLTLLLKVIEQEEELFAVFFFDDSVNESKGSTIVSSSSSPGSPRKKSNEFVHVKFSIAPLIRSYCSIFYEEMRYLVIKYAGNKIEPLCEILGIVKSGFINKNKRLDKVLLKISNDLEELICFKSNQFVQKELADFPSREISEIKAKNYLEEVKGIEDDVEKGMKIILLTIEDFELKVQLLIELTKKLLNKLFHVISKRSFEKLVQEAIIHTTRGLIEFSKSIGKEREKLAVLGERAKKETLLYENTSVELNVLLFLLQYLLKVREIISIYKISFVRTEISLDFSHISNGIMNFLKGKSGFSFKTIVFDILVNSQPKVLYKKIETRKNLDNEIKTVCENLILNIAKFCFDDIIQVVYEFKDIGVGTNEDLKGVDVEKIYNKNLKHLKTKIESINRIIQRNLQNATTRLLLVDPIQNNFRKIYSQYLEIIEKANLSGSFGESAKVSKTGGTSNVVDDKNGVRDRFVLTMKELEQIIEDGFRVVSEESKSQILKMTVAVNKNEQKESKNAST